MNEFNDAFCPNKECKDYGLQNHGNITVRGKYGKDKTKDLLYCRTCGQRFASTRATAFFGLHLSDEKIEQIIHHAAEGVGVNPTPFIFAVCIGASACFATPIGYQTTLLVYGPGGYRFSDYLKMGIPLNLIVLAAGSVLIPYFWPF